MPGDLEYVLVAVPDDVRWQEQYVRSDPGPHTLLISPEGGGYWDVDMHSCNKQIIIQAFDIGTED